MSHLTNQIAQWVKITKSFSDFTDTDLTNDIEIFSLPAKGIIHGCLIKHSTAFAGTGITVVTISVGKAGALTKYVIAFDVFQVVSATAVAPSVLTAPVIESYTGSTSIRAAITTTLGNIDALNAGSVDIWLLVSVLP